VFGYDSFLSSLFFAYLYKQAKAYPDASDCQVTISTYFVADNLKHRNMFYFCSWRLLIRMNVFLFILISGTFIDFSISIMFTPGEWIRSDPITGMILLAPCTSFFGPEVSSYSLFTIPYIIRHAPNSNRLGIGTILFSQVFFLYFRYSFI